MTNKIKKAEILGIVDYLMSGPYIGNYELYDDLHHFNLWARKCSDWLTEQANDMD